MFLEIPVHLKPCGCCVTAVQQVADILSGAFPLADAFPGLDLEVELARCGMLSDQVPTAYRSELPGAGRFRRTEDRYRQGRLRGG